MRNTEKRRDRECARSDHKGKDHKPHGVGAGQGGENLITKVGRGRALDRAGWNEGKEETYHWRQAR